MRKLLPLALAAALIPATAKAQLEGAFDMGVLGMNGAIDHVTKSEQARARGLRFIPPSRHIARSLSLQATGRAAPAAAAATVSGAYRPSKAVRDQIAGIMADGAEQRKPGTAEEMRQLVTSGKALSEYQRIAPMLGYRTNDAVDALAFYLLAQWGIANDHRADVTRAQAAGVRRQAANAYASVADQIGTDAQRQEFAEVLVVQGIIMSGVHEAAARSNDRAALAEYASMARQGGRELFTMDPTRIALTDEGFREK